MEGSGELWLANEDGRWQDWMGDPDELGVREEGPGSGGGAWA